MALTNTPRPAGFVGKLKGYAKAEGSLHGKEHAGSTWKAGAFLIDDDAGLITETTADLDGSAVTHRTLGLAIADATGVTSADVHMIDLLTDEYLVEMTLSDATAGTHTLAQADVWQTFPVKKSTNWYADANAKSANGALVVELKDPIGTVDGRVYVKLTRACLGPAHAASGAA